MSHFAKVIDGKVVEVIVIEQDVLNTGHWGDPSLWIQTSYNTRGNVHLLGGIPLRKNYAGIGPLKPKKAPAQIRVKPTTWLSVTRSPR